MTDPRNSTAISNVIPFRTTRKDKLTQHVDSSTIVQVPESPEEFMAEYEAAIARQAKERGE